MGIPKITAAVILAATLAIGCVDQEGPTAPTEQPEQQPEQLFHRHGAYSHDSERKTTNPDWMAQLNDNLRIYDLTIPGTHDTYSHYGGDAVMTQTMRIDDQLHSGIRALDVRLKVVVWIPPWFQEGLMTWHGSVPQLVWFDAVLSTMDNFLKNHPTETIFMRVKEEDGNHPAQFEEYFKDYIEPYSDSDLFWKPPVGLPDYTNPKLSEVRGKIVILQDFPGADGLCTSSADPICTYGLNWKWLRNPAGGPDPSEGNVCYTSKPGFRTFIQDRYHFSSNWDLDNKWACAKTHFEKTASGLGNETGCQRDGASVDNCRPYINFLSGAGWSFPYFVASGHSSPQTGAPRLLWCCGKCPAIYHKNWLGLCYYEGMNIVTYNYLGKQMKVAGIVMTDFPGRDLIELLIGLNPGIDLPPLNNPPVPDANGPYEGNEASEITFDASASYDPDGDPLTYTWDLDYDGVWDTDWSSSPTAAHTWYDDYSGIVLLGVFDGGIDAQDGAYVTVNNVAPAAAIDGYTSPVEGCILPGQVVSFSGSFTDPGHPDTHTAGWDFGDGTLLPGTLIEENDPPDATGTVSDSHTYGEPGTFTVDLEVVDDDGGTGTAATSVKVMTAEEALDFINDYIQDLAESSFRGPAAQRANSLSNKLEEVKNILDSDDPMGAVNKLINDIRDKMDGSLGGNPRNDWIVDAEAQADLCLMIDELVAYVERSYLP